MARNQAGAGVLGNSIYPYCKTIVPHKRGVPCYFINYPNCGISIIRSK